ncbi:MAG TPA: phenylalanine--tRNA ligase subunit alpha [bacterium]|nr:phenylalanine--tRNA ligase subunit alpha [bacterium]HPJ71319.1 phenylalanine--tRNA ligase subunit alpha [bacterium]HPQ66186.1 phenylalanine--tRNA ligase subunit alpha [bacterium]
MKDELEQICAQALDDLSRVEDEAALEEFQIQYLGRKGRITSCMKSVGKLPPEQRPEMGALANRIKGTLASECEQCRLRLAEAGFRERVRRDRVDVTLPGHRYPRGHIHPLTRTAREMISIFEGMGFVLETGPEVETEWYNFDALNIPSDHPARDMQDTLYLDRGFLLRTHTSPVQIRTMERGKPPLRMICAGRTFRADSVDASHSPMFHQLEGLMVDTDISFAHLKAVLSEFVRRFFGPDTKLRFRPSFFPFTEPSADGDISCIVCGGRGCSLCSRKGWLEILGAGMVDPHVFRAVGYDPDLWRGFAFGLGIDRCAMLRYGIDDIRLFYENDLRFLDQF